MKIKVEVTQEHINRGKREKCQKCPIAQALFELGLAPAVWVEGGGDDSIFLGYMEKQEPDALGKKSALFIPFAVASRNSKARKFIRKFDSTKYEGCYVPRKDLKPFSLVLNFSEYDETTNLAVLRREEE